MNKIAHDLLFAPWMRKKEIIKVFFLMCMFLAPQIKSPVNAQDTICYNDRCDLKILSWNIYGLPSYISHKGLAVRSRLIAEYLKDADFDIVIFQEAFTAKSRRIIRSILCNSFPYQLGPANEKTHGIRLNSGIWIISKVPLNFVSQIQFSISRGFDRFSRKGALMVEGTHNGTVFQLVGTHLNSGSSQKVRDKQYKQMVSRLLEPNKKEDIPQIICGDFNTNKQDKTSYSRMLEILNVPDYEMAGACLYSYDGINNDLTGKRFRGQDIIDFIFFRPNGLTGQKIDRSIHPVYHSWSSSHKDLSDHYAVAATIEF
jgi:endonuclease/exonuclease/phosphatase family metal-dependent hydrolase